MMKNNIVFVILLWGCMLFPSLATPIVEDGIYSISCQQTDGYVALGAYQNVNPYVCYISNGQPLTADAYWMVTNTAKGYTFRNEVSGEYLVYTAERVDIYYKYMTLSTEESDNESLYWNITEVGDGSLYINSMAKPSFYWNLRASQGLLGTYSGSSRSVNERFYLTKKETGTEPAPDSEPETQTSFPAALHVYLTDGRIEAYPLNMVTSHKEVSGQLHIETSIGQTFTYTLTDVERVSEEAPTDLPTFESFKFNNKYNDQLFNDAIGEMLDDTVFVTIAAIGKRLTPSFKLPDDQTLVYVNGVLQDSKTSRLRFDEDIYYVVTRPGITMWLPNAETPTTYSMQPYGRVVRVHVNWLTDRAEVPTIYINTADGQPITSKDYYKDAEITIDGHGIFPSMETTAVQIKGRGNSSWGWTKKPYRLKFAEKVKPLGMTKGKSWVLLANGISGSLMTNAIGMKAANLMKAAAANHIVPVDIYLNGEYRGSYNFTEKVGLSNNSVDLDDDTAAALLELDSYYDESTGQKFRSTPYNLPINIKEPDFSEGLTSLTLETISSSFNSFVSTLYRGQDISKHVDIEQLVRYMMVNELTLNYEFYHPKSTFCYRENFAEDTCKYIFGPVWDLDWCFGYERSGNYFVNEATSNYWIDMPAFEVREFIRDLRWKYTPLNDVYRELWEGFMNNDLQELLEYCQDYYEFAHNSFDANRLKWGDKTNYEQQAQNAASWLQTRTQNIYDDIISDKRPNIPAPVEFVEFDNNKLYTITCRRGALVLNADHTALTVEQQRYDASDEEYQFAIIGIEGNNYLYSPVVKKYLAYNNNGTWVNMLGTSITFDPSNADNEYLYMMSVNSDEGQTLYFNHNTSTLVINSYTNPDAGNRWMIEEVDDFDPTEALELASASLYAVTNRYLFNGEVVGSEILQVPYGSLPPEPSDKWTNAYVALKEPSDIPYQITEEATIDYEVEWFGPFRFTYSLDDAYWYNMTIRSDYCVGKDESEPYYPTSEIDEETLKQAEFQWAFGGDPFHVQVYNRSTGLDEVLMRSGANAVMRQGDYSWDLLPNSDGFVLRENNTEYSCINQIGGSGGPLQFWNNSMSITDDGSTFRVFEAPDVILLGDVNSDGEVDLSDAIMVTYFSLHVAPANFNKAAADMNNDGEVDLSDAISIIYKTLGVK